MPAGGVLAPSCSRWLFAASTPGRADVVRRSALFNPMGCISDKTHRKNRKINLPLSESDRGRITLSIFLALRVEFKRMGESDSVATVPRAIASSPRQASLTARTPRRAGVARRSPLFNPSCRPAALPPWRPADLPTADLLTRRPATCRPAQLPTCRLASWPTAASTSPTMTARAMAIAITHATATMTANGGPYMDNIYPNPAAQDAPRTPDLILEDLASKGARVDKTVRTPESPPIPSSTLIWGAGGINIPSKSALGSNILPMYCPWQLLVSFSH